MRRPSESTLLFAVSPALDGYLTVTTGFIIAALIASQNITAIEVSLLAGGFMTGTFLGAALIGRPADRFGRAPFARTLLSAMVPLLALPFLTDRIDVLIAFQIILGLLIGADQPISQAYITETSTNANRRRRLSSLMLAWYFGALVAIGMMPILSMANLSWRGFYLLPLGLTFIAAFVRYFVNETPAWTPNIDQQTQNESLFSTHARSLFFCCSFWLCQTIPVTVLMFYSPVILADVTGSDDQIGRITLIYCLFLVGTLPMTFLTRQQKPNRILKYTAMAMACGLCLVAIVGNQSPFLLSLAFAIYALAYGMQTTLDNLYPNILFPTRLRARAVGTILAVSRVGSALSAFVFPLLMSHFDLKPILLGGALIALLGYASILVLPKEARN